MTLLVNTSVVLKWFHQDGESEVAQARALLQAPSDSRERILVLDLAAYELGNVLLRALGLPALVVAQQLRLLLTLCDRWCIPVPPGSIRRPTLGTAWLDLLRRSLGGGGAGPAVTLGQRGSAPAREGPRGHRHRGRG